MANSAIQTIRDAEVDARSLSEFISKDASFTVTRRLAPTIHTLDYYLDKLEQLEPTVIQRVEDAINNTAIEGGVLADTFVVATPKFKGAVARTQAGKNTQLIDVSDFVDFDADNHTSGLKAAVDAAKVLHKGLVCRDTRTLKINAVVDLSGVSEIILKGDVLCTGAGRIIIGGFSNSGEAANIRFKAITNGTSELTDPPPALPLLDVQGLKAGQLRVSTCNYVRIYADGDSPLTSSNAYSDIYFDGTIRKLEITDSNTGYAWNTENRFYGGRLIQVLITGRSYQHNHNKFYNPTLEGDIVDVRLNNAAENAFYGIRGEMSDGYTGFKVAENCFNNKFIFSWSTSFSSSGAYVPSYAVNDLGVNTIFMNEYQYMGQSASIFNFDASTQFLANATGSTSTSAVVNPKEALFIDYSGEALVPTLSGVQGAAFKNLVQTDYIAVTKGNVITFDCDYEGDALRAFYALYDSDKQPITTGAPGIEQIGVSRNEKGFVYSHTTDISSDTINRRAAQIIDGRVAYVRVGLMAGKAAMYKRLSAKLWGNKINAEAAQYKLKTMSLNGPPTMGYVPLDTPIIDTLTGRTSVCVFAHETSLSAGVSATALTVTVKDATGVTDGCICGIQMPSGKTHWSAVSGLSGNTFNITAIPEATFLDARVVFNKWSVTTA